VVRDDLAVIQCLGLDLEDAIAQLAQGDLGKPQAGEVHGEIERTVGQAAPAPYPQSQRNGFGVDDFVRRTLHEVWNRRMLGELRRAYAPNYVCHTMGEQHLYGRGAYAAWVLALLAAFPDGQLLVDQLYWMDDGGGRVRTSLRWSLGGTHSGAGVFGPPTGVRCRVWGITQHHIRDGQFVEEWTYTNELAVRKRLWLARHDQLGR
jgi:predicted ester cyclase